MLHPNTAPAAFPSASFIETAPDVDTIKAAVREAHQQGAQFDARALDTLLLGQQPADFEAAHKADRNNALSEFPREETWGSGHDSIWTPYNIASAALHHPEVTLTPRDIFYDLGSGYGRVPLFVGIISGAQCRGVELLPYRCNPAQMAAERLELPNVTFANENVRAVDFSDGTMFYLYYPFSRDTFNIVVGQLRAVARKRQITILARCCASVFKNQDWVEPIGRAESSRSMEGNAIILRSRE